MIIHQGAANLPIDLGHISGRSPSCFPNAVLPDVKLTPGTNGQFGQSLLVAPCIGCLWGVGMKSSRHFQKEVVLFISSLDLGVKMG